LKLRSRDLHLERQSLKASQHEASVRGGELEHVEQLYVASQQALVLSHQEISTLDVQLAEAHASNATLRGVNQSVCHQLRPSVFEKELVSQQYRRECNRVSALTDERRALSDALLLANAANLDQDLQITSLTRVHHSSHQMQTALLVANLQSRHHYPQLSTLADILKHQLAAQAAFISTLQHELDSALALLGSEQEQVHRLIGVSVVSWGKRRDLAHDLDPRTSALMIAGRTNQQQADELFLRPQQDAYDRMRDRKQDLEHDLRSAGMENERLTSELDSARSSYQTLSESHRGDVEKLAKVQKRLQKAIYHARLYHKAFTVMKDRLDSRKESYEHARVGLRNC